MSSILYTDVVYHKGKNTNHGDSSVNGGGIGEIVQNEQINSIFPEVTATQREAGLTLRTKLIVSNNAVGRKMQDTLISIYQDVLSPDRIKLFEATEKTRVSMVLNQEVSGGASPVVAGTDIQVASLTPNGTTTADLVGRRLVISGETVTVASAPNVNTVTFSESINSNLSSGEEFHADDVFDSVEDDDTFVDGDAFVSSPMNTTFQNGTSEITVPYKDMANFSSGTDVVVVDGYFRSVFRASVVGAVVDPEDANMCIVSLNKSYNGSFVIPSGEGFLSSSIKRTILSGEAASFWVELTIAPDDDIINSEITQFKLGLFFDDVSE